MNVLSNPLLARGGPVMYVLLGLSVVATAIVLLKAWQFGRLRTRRLDCIAELIEAGPHAWTDGARERLGACRHPVARALEASLGAAADDSLGPGQAQAEVERIGSREMRAMEGWLRALSAIGHLSPLLGLLGTVLGMITAFMRIEEAGSAVDPALLSGGIWQALLTTAFGLTIAIPSMAAVYLFEGEVDRVRATMKDVSTRVLVAAGKLPEATSSYAESAGDYDFAV